MSRPLAPKDVERPYTAAIMTSPDKPTSDRPATPGSGSAPKTGNVSGAQAPKASGQRRRRSGGSSSGASGKGQSDGGGQRQGGKNSGGQRADANAGNRSSNRSGGNSGSRSGGKGSGGKGSSGNRTGSGGRGSQGPSRGGAGSGSRQPAAVAPLRIDRSADLADESAATANRRRAMLLCIAPAGILGVLSAVVFAVLGLVIIAVIALIGVTIAGAFWLRRSSAERVVASLGAQRSNEDDRPRLHNLVDGLCATMGLDRPDILVVDSPLPNALCVGRDAHRTTLVVTTGLEPSLSLVELEGVLAHELIHIKREDSVIAGVAVVIGALVSLVAGEESGIDAVHRMVGLGREYSADQRAAQVVRYPEGIGGALAVMAEGDAGLWPPGGTRMARLTRWLWIDPIAGSTPETDGTGELDDTRVRAAALALGSTRAKDPRSSPIH